MPSTSGILSDIASAISVAGVMGYPAKNRHPLAMAPSAQATSPLKKCSPVLTAGLMLLMVGVLCGGYDFFFGDMYRELRTYQLTQAAGDAFSIFLYPGGMITFCVEFFRYFKDALWAEFCAELATFTSILNQVDRTQGWCIFRSIKRFSPVRSRNCFRSGRFGYIWAHLVDIRGLLTLKTTVMRQKSGDDLKWDVNGMEMGRDCEWDGILLREENW
jgi:hypothetical protein